MVRNCDICLTFAGNVCNVCNICVWIVRSSCILLYMSRIHASTHMNAYVHGYAHELVYASPLVSGVSGIHLPVCLLRAMLLCSIA